MEHLHHTLFLDIETVPLVAGYDLLSEGMQHHWARKAQSLKVAEIEKADPALLFKAKAAIYAEFAKIVCISFGSFHEGENGLRFRVKSLANDDEKILLNDFCDILSRFSKIHYHTSMRLCGHNVREFDVPFICRRMVLNGLSLPQCLQVQGKRPWDIRHIDDTMEMWRFGDFKNFTSLALLAEILGIPTPKDDMDGSMVGQVYWEEHNLPRIARYCAKDVVTTAKVFLRLKGITDVAVEPLFVDEVSSLAE